MFYLLRKIIQTFFVRDVPQVEKIDYPTEVPEEITVNQEEQVLPDSNQIIKESSAMELELLRFSSQKETTLGLLFDNTNGREFLCFTLEDEYRTKKVYAETRIPAGVYKIKLRTVGGFHEKYSERFSSIHKGMLWLQDVPNFEYVLIHIGNKDDDTAGCILVGDNSSQNITEEGLIGQSTAAYVRIYPKIAQELSKGNEVILKIIDYDMV